MTHLRGDLTSSLLDPALRARFSDLFRVAARKSVFAWQETTVPHADVVLLDRGSDQRALQPRPPCVIWVGTDLPGSGHTNAWTARLAPDYTLSDLIDTLDRAAVFLLDWKARRPAPVAAMAPVTSPASASDNSSKWLSGIDVSFSPSSINAEADAHDRRYRLAKWVYLGAPFDSPDGLSAMALLARQSVTMQQIQTHTGLAPVQVVDLLQELARRNVLQVSAPAMVLPLKPPVSRKAEPVRQGFLRRLSHWIQGAQR
jgi:hypothetical protein